MTSWFPNAFAEGPQWAIALHGGASRLPRDMPEERQAKYREALTQALRTGVEALKAGDSALDATQKTVVVLEDCPLFNAGRGSSFDRAGGHTMDASIMDGKTRRCGGVAGVTILKNPIEGARAVMNNTPHVLLSGEPAERLAISNGAATAPRHYFSVPFRFEALREKMTSQGLNPPKQPLHGWPDELASEAPFAEDAGGTVGCVALDIRGGLAAATSTGGHNGKMVGRIGDSPIPGAGNYANSAVAVGGTGKGEEYLRYFIAGRIALLVESGAKDLDSAVVHCLNEVLKPGDGGAIAVDREGNLSLRATTDSMPRGAASSQGLFEVAIWPDTQMKGQ